MKIRLSYLLSNLGDIKHAKTIDIFYSDTQNTVTY